MKIFNHPTLAAEVEFGLETPDGKQIYQLPSAKNRELVLANRAVLDFIQQAGDDLFPRAILSGVKPELDACQLEICNSKPHSSAEEVADELANMHYELQKVIELIANEIGQEIVLSTRAVPVDQDFEPLASNTAYYQQMHDAVIQKAGIDIRKLMNCRGLHIHHGVFSKEQGLNIINALIHKERGRKGHILSIFADMINLQRYEFINQILRALGKNLMPTIMTDFDPNKGSEANSHAILRYSKYNTVENRLPDFGLENSTAESLYNIINVAVMRTQDLLNDVVEKYNLSDREVLPV